MVQEAAQGREFTHQHPPLSVREPPCNSAQVAGKRGPGMEEQQGLWVRSEMNWHS